MIGIQSAIKLGLLLVGKTDFLRHLRDRVPDVFFDCHAFSLSLSDLSANNSLMANVHNLAEERRDDSQNCGFGD